MSLPVIHRIEEEIRKRLLPALPAVPDRSGETGQVAVVRPGRFVGNSDAIVIQKASDKQVPALDIPGNPPGVAFEAVFNVNCFIDSMPNESEFSQACEEATAEIIHAITTPSISPVTWFRFEGLAMRAWFGTKKDLPTDTGKKGGVSVPLSVIYRVAENDHTVVR